MNPLLISEIKSTLSPLAELSKAYETLPDKDLNKSLGEGVIKRLPRNGGVWNGVPGNSTWCPDRDIIPQKDNTEGKTWGTILEEKKIEGISFKDGEPDFSAVSKGTVEIKSFCDERYGIGGNFDQANQELAQQKGWTKQEVQSWMRENNYTWHERSDCKTMDAVPREIHNNIAHSGGISLIKNQIEYGR